MQIIYKFLIFICIVNILIQTDVKSQTPGTLTVTVTTSNAGGNYQPQNVLAIWIEDNSGNFVQSLMVYGQQYLTHLNIWQASTASADVPNNRTDAITGATRSSHATRTCTWDGTDYTTSNTLMPDGTYRVRMELTDKNSTGNYSTFTFNKSASPQTLTPSNQPSFTSVTLQWEPDLSDIQTAFSDKAYMVIPNPAYDYITVNGIVLGKIEIRNMTGSLVISSEQTKIDISKLPEGIYFLSVTTPSGKVVRKFAKLND